MYIYSDTDSIHTSLGIEELKQFCDIDDVKLRFLEKWTALQQDGKFIRQKCYLEEIEGKIKITCAGMPQSCYSQVEWDKFKTGFSCRRKTNI